MIIFKTYLFTFIKYLSNILDDVTKELCLIINIHYETQLCNFALYSSIIKVVDGSAILLIHSDNEGEYFDTGLVLCSIIIT